MKDINVILSKIEQEAKKAAADTLADAKANSEKIAADYDAKIAQQRAEILANADAQVAAIKLRNDSQCGILERNENLKTRRASIDVAFKKAEDMLCDMSAEKKIAFYSDMAVSIVNEDSEIILNAKEKAEFGEVFVEYLNKKLKGAKVKLADNVGGFTGGFMLKNGNIETNCTFEVLVSRAKDELEPEVAKVLFG